MSMDSGRPIQAAAPKGAGCVVTAPRLGKLSGRDRKVGPPAARPMRDGNSPQGTDP